jgi:L-asparagine transporter-like permease
MTTELSAHPAVREEQVLTRALSSGQQAMIAIGGAIGTGLFLASGAAVPAAGPAVIFSTIFVAAISLLLGAVLTEMCVAHPTAGSFGLYAEMYLSPFLGYAVRMSYWLSQVVVIGGHMVAIATYMHFWLPSIPDVVWILLFSVILLYINARAVGTFGEFGYWFSMIKVVALALFTSLGIAVLTGFLGESPGLANYVERGGFFPKGWSGVWLAACFTFYSFIGVEMAAVASGEAAEPSKSIPRAFRRLVFGLAFIYIVTTTVLVGVVPWDSFGVTESPFVSVLRTIGIPGAAGLMNFVVLTAALSAANSSLYLVARTLFSLSRSGLLPASFGGVNHRGVPVRAIALSGVGLALALVVQIQLGSSAYIWFIGVALFGALFCWLMIFVTHVGFRIAWERKGAPPPEYRTPFGKAGSVVGALVMFSILVSTWWTPGLRVTLQASLPWLALVAVAYWFSLRAKRRAQQQREN